MQSTADMHKESDRWGKEIEYQKVFNLTPTEAGLYVLSEKGSSATSIAESTGLSVQTVRNTLTNARKKIRGGGMAEIYIIKQTQFTDNSMVKTNIIEVLASLCKKTINTKINNMTHLIKLSEIDKSEPGDIEWMNTNVFRFVDFVGTRNESMSEERADRMAQVYNQRMHEQNLTKPKMGYAVIKYWLDYFYIPYDIIEE